MTYHIITFGCQMNEADSDLMASLLEEAGWQAAGSREQADLIVLNTCSVRERPEHKVYSLLGELRAHKHQRPEAVIAVAGCMAQAEGEALTKRAPHVGVVVGTRSFHRLPELVARARSGARPVIALGMEEDPSELRCRPAAEARKAPLRAFVPVIRGCTNYCSYCIVPYVRGTEASRPRREIADEVRRLVSGGAREVTLLGQNVLAYGRDASDGATFPELLREIARVEGLWRVRFLTCHPRNVSDALISAMAELPAVCEHIHLPIQAGTDRLLTEMNRGYTVAQYLGAVSRLRAGVPGLAVTTDMMVGYPGETDEEFAESLGLYEKIGFDAAFTFAYSPRPGTAAARETDQVPRATKLARLQRLIAVQNEITKGKHEAQVGSIAEVLVEGRAEKGEGLLAGKTRQNMQVVFGGKAELAGSLAMVRLTEAYLWGFRGELSG